MIDQQIHAGQHTNQCDRCLCVGPVVGVTLTLSLGDEQRQRLWLCRDCIKDFRCPDCGNHLTDAHRCGVPILLAAIGDVKLTDMEKRYIRWLAGCGDYETVDVFAGLFAKLLAKHKETA